MIYIIHEEQNDNFKIGYTKSDPLARLRICKTHCPYPVSLLGTFSGDMKKEKKLHERFFSNRTRDNGEWFHADKKEMIKLVIEEGGSLYEEPLSKNKDKYSVEIISKLYSKCEEQEKRIQVLEKQLLLSKENNNKSIVKSKFDLGIVASIQKECSVSFTIYNFLLLRANERNEISIGSKEIAKFCGCSRGTVSNAVTVLTLYGLIEVKGRNQGRKSIFIIKG